MTSHHIQGKDISSINIGSFYNGELVSVMTFSKGNLSKGVKKVNEYVWELSRFCIDDKYHIPGISGKLLSYFKQNYTWKEIYSYADKRWSEGGLYYQLGFECDKKVRLNYWYVKNYQRIHRFNLRKKENEPRDISERILRLKEGYSIIWDCGNLKFTLENDSYQ